MKIMLIKQNDNKMSMVINWYSFQKVSQSLSACALFPHKLSAKLTKHLRNLLEEVLDQTMNAIKRQNQKSQKNQKGCRATALLSVANQCDNPLLKIDPSFCRFNKNDSNLSLTCHRWPELDEECQQWMIQLTEDNMKPYYESSSSGWSRSTKLKEFKHKTSRLLILKCLDSNQLIAFVNFRFEVGGTDSESAVYCYELQVVGDHQRSGVGQYLMGCLYEMGLAFHMQKVMLTVFKQNTIAMDFYTKALNYRIDRSSPSRCQTVADYEILCLTINKNSIIKD